MRPALTQPPLIRDNRHTPERGRGDSPGRDATGADALWAGMGFCPGRSLASRRRIPALRERDARAEVARIDDVSVSRVGLTEGRGG